MKKFKKAGYFLYCLLFFAACAVPGTMLLCQPENSNSEKRQLAKFPSIHTKDGSLNQKWGSEFQSYVSDHFGFRQTLVNADSRMKATLLHTSAEEDVIIGQDGWLYYTATVNDYIGNPTVSLLGIQNIVHNLELMQEYAAQTGSVFTVAVVPNKNTVYPDFMPYYYKNSGISNNLDNLKAAVSETDINWCDLSDTLISTAKSSDTLLYHKTDTHWNNTGALIGYQTMMDAVGMPYHSYSDATYTIQPEWKGDLQGMLFPESDVLDDQTVYDIGFTYSYQGHYRNSDDITINTSNPDGTGSLLMFRDSFGAAIIPYFSQQFQTARYSRSRPNPIYLLEEQHYDAVILEIVERNIAWLQKEAPMHSALPAENVPSSDKNGDATLYTDQNGSSLLHIYGTVSLPENLTKAATYYVTITEESGSSASYIAYNCYESDQLEDTEIRDNGYSLYIPTDTLTEGKNYTVNITAETEQGCILCEPGDFIYTP